MASKKDVLVQQLAAIDQASLEQVLCMVLDSRPELAPPVVSFACPQFTYPPAKAVTQRRAVGVIKCVDPNTGLAYISCPEVHAVFGQDVTLHQNQFGQFGIGDKVSFAVLLTNENKPQAYDLCPPNYLDRNPSWNAPGHGYGVSAEQISAQQYSGMSAAAAMALHSQQTGCPVPMAVPGGYADSNRHGGAFPVLAGGSGPKDPNGRPMKRDGRPDEQEILGHFRGIIKSFNHMSGYGFIHCDQLRSKGFNNDVFLHHQALESFELHDEVHFTCFLNKKGQPQSKDLKPTPNTASLLRQTGGVNTFAIERPQPQGGVGDLL